MCLSALGLIVAVLSIAAFVSIGSGNAALETLLRDRIVALRDLKIVADARVARLRTILSRGDRPALDAFVLHDLYQGIDPVSAAMRTARIGRDVMIGLMLVAAIVVPAIGPKRLPPLGKHVPRYSLHRA